MSVAPARTNRRQRSHRWKVSAVLLAFLLVLVAFVNRPIRGYYYLSKGRQALSDGAPRLRRFAAFQSAHEIDSKNAETGFWLARACRKMGDLSGLRKYLTEAQQRGYHDKKRLEREMVAASG